MKFSLFRHRIFLLTTYRLCRLAITQRSPGVCPSMLSDWAAALHLLHWARSDCVLYRLCCSFVDSGLELIQYLILFLFCVIGMHCHEALILIAERVDIRACVCESLIDVTLGFAESFLCAFEQRHGQVLGAQSVWQGEDLNCLRAFDVVNFRFETVRFMLTTYPFFSLGITRQSAQACPLMLSDWAASSRLLHWARSDCVFLSLVLLFCGLMACVHALHIIPFYFCDLDALSRSLDS